MQADLVSRDVVCACACTCKLASFNSSGHISLCLNFLYFLFSRKNNKEQVLYSYHFDLLSLHIPT